MIHQSCIFSSPPLKNALNPIFWFAVTTAKSPLVVILQFGVVSRDVSGSTSSRVSSARQSLCHTSDASWRRCVYARTANATRRLIPHLSFQREATTAVQPTSERTYPIACRQLPVGGKRRPAWTERGSKGEPKMAAGDGN